MADWGFHRNKMEYFYNLCLLFCKNKQQQQNYPSQPLKCEIPLNWTCKKYQTLTIT